MNHGSTNTRLHEIIDSLTPAQQRHLLEIARRWHECAPTRITPPPNRAFLGHDPDPTAATLWDEADQHLERDEP